MLYILGMKKLIIIFIVFPFFISCNNAKWTPLVKNNYMRSCIINFIDSSEKAGNKSTNQQARCYCIFSLDKTIELYPNPNEADENLSAADLQLIVDAAIVGLNNVKDLNTCL